MNNKPLVINNSSYEAGQITVGSLGAGSSGIRGDVYEIINCSSKLSSENRGLVEDYLIFGESDSRKIDLRETRLKPKTDAEAQADSEQAQSNVEQLSSKNVKLKIDLTNGKSETIILPVESFESIKSISVVEE